MRLNKFQLSPSILELSKNFKGILLDAYGVFWSGGATGVFPNADQTMKALVEQKKIVGILSNSTQLIEKEMNKLALHGIEYQKHFHFLLTSGEVAKQFFSNAHLPFPTPHQKYWIFGGIHPRFSPPTAIFNESVFNETAHIHEADFIYVGIPHLNGEDQTNAAVFLKDIQKLKESSLPMVCANPDRFAHEGDPPQAVVRQGMIAALYEELGGKIYYIGKPYDQVYSKALELFSTLKINSASDILMVGDTPETDIRGAFQNGLQSVLLTETGIMSERIKRQGIDKAISDLSASDFPTYFLRKFAHDF